MAERVRIQAKPPQPKPYEEPRLRASACLDVTLIIRAALRFLTTAEARSVFTDLAKEVHGRDWDKKDLTNG